MAEVALAAAIPAALYYFALFMAIHFRAAKMGLEPSGRAETEPVMARIHLLLPLFVIVLVLILGRSPMRAAFLGVASAWAVTWLRKDTRMMREAWYGALESGGTWIGPGGHGLRGGWNPWSAWHP